MKSSKALCRSVIEYISNPFAITICRNIRKLNVKMRLKSCERGAIKDAEQRKGFDMTLYKAMAAAFPKIEGALKDNENEAFKRGGKATKYADLASVVNAVKPALSDQQLFFIQMTHEQQGGVCVETIVCHESGEQMSFGKLFVPAVKNDAQGYGSALTYARRYSLMTAFGVCPEDDDGNAAVKSTPQHGNGSRITEQQEAAIRKLMAEVEADEKRFLNYINVPSIEAIMAKDYDRVISVLENKRKAA